MIHRITTRTSPFGYYATCSCGYVSESYRPTHKAAWDDALGHAPGEEKRSAG